MILCDHLLHEDTIFTLIYDTQPHPHISFPRQPHRIPHCILTEILFFYPQQNQPFQPNQRHFEDGISLPISVIDYFKIKVMGIKIATADDLDWVNEQYTKADFVHSTLENETIAIVLHNDCYAGVGRLVHLNAEEAEMGGIYILEEFRGRSLANELVGYLVGEVKKKGLKHVYCLPFEELQMFYEKFGFKQCDDEVEPINPHVLKKFHWCQQNYEKKVLLLKLQDLIVLEGGVEKLAP